MKITLHKPIPVKLSVDVLVVGAGPSGLCAAVAASRLGAKTLLVERYGALGGNLTLGHVSPISGNVCAGTLGNEIAKNGRLKIPLGRFAHDPEALKQALPGWLKEANVSFYLQTVLADVLKDENRVTGGVFTSPEGLFAIASKQMIDATGDALACRCTGAPVLSGCETDGVMQPVSLMFTVSGVDEELAITCQNYTYDVRMPDSQPEFRRQCAIASQNGLLPRAAAFVRLYRTVRPGDCLVNTTQENFIDATNVEDIQKAEISLRSQITHVTEFLKSNVSGFSNCYVSSSACTLGVRETNRIDGEYCLTEEDIRSGRKFPDAIVHNANFILDVHGMKHGGQDVSECVPDYDIPYGCLVPKEADNIIAVGRAISGTHLACSSYRAMRICMALGEAGGIAAALCALEHVSPHALDPQKVRQVLCKNGVSLRDEEKIGII